MQYAYRRPVDLDVTTAVERVTAELAAEGFGVLTTIDVQATLEKKLGAQTAPYIILGACNPEFAHGALQIERDLGLLLPCNVVVYEGQDGQTVVAAIDAQAMLSIVENPALGEVAEDVSARLRAAVDRV